MILYNEDWAKFPGSAPDYSTKNLSFLKLAKVYHKMGIKNCLFLLALHDQGLKGVDPFDPNLSLEMKLRIIEEAKLNPWYYFREIARVPVQGSPEPSMNLAHRANIALIWCFLNGFDYANIMPRQCGKSVAADLLNNWLMHVAGNNTVIQLFTHSNKLRNANVKRLKQIRDLLPPFMNFFQPGIDPDNQERLGCKHLNTEYLTSVAQKDKDAADNAGRGLTSPIIQVDEGPFCPNIHISLPVALGSTGAAREWARARGTFMGNIFTTTAGKRDSEEGGYMYDLIHDGMYWREHIFDCENRAAAARMIVANSKQGDAADARADGEDAVDDEEVLMINGTFSALQLGKSLAWLRGRINSVRGSRENAERDYLNVWTSGTDCSPLPTELLGVIREARKEPLYTQTSKEGYLLDWYIPEREIKQRMNASRFVMTIDTANMIGRDGNAMTIIDLKTMEVVAASDINEGSLYRYIDWIFDLLIAYDRTTLVMENKSSAQVIFDGIAAKMISIGINPFRRMFNHIVNDHSRHEKAYQELLQIERSTGVTNSFYERYKQRFGFMTTGKSRDTLYGEVFQRAAKTTGHLISSKALSDQILGLTLRGNRIDHAKNKHDDMVISWLMGQWFSTLAVNLQYYGIEYGLVQSLVSEAGATISPEEAESRRIQEQTMDKIAQLNAMLSTADELTRSAIELRIARYARQLDVSDQDKVMADLFERSRSKENNHRSLKEAVRKNSSEKKVSGWY